MASLTYSNRLCPLIDTLVARLNASRSAISLLPSTIIVESSLQENFLQQEISSRAGVCANLQFFDMETWLQEQSKHPPKFYDHGAMLSELLSLFETPKRLQAPVFTPLHAYLPHPTDLSDRASLSRFQLADRIATHFVSYQEDLPEILEEWNLQSPPLFQEETSESVILETVQWQRALWKMLQDEKSLKKVSHTPSTSKTPPILHVFGYHSAPKSWQTLLANLATQTDLHLYLLSPNIEFLEDIPPTLFSPEQLFQFDSRKHLPQNQERSLPKTNKEEPPLLQLWGKAGRLHLRSLQNIPNIDCKPLFVDPLTKHKRNKNNKRNTLLTHLQHDILTRQSERRRPRNALDLPPDNSIKVMACPNPQREAEAVSDAIWAMVSDPKSPIPFDQIGLLLPPAQQHQYLARIETAFSQNHQIPFNTNELPPGQQGRLLEALNLLLDLPFGDFGREEMLAILTHPNIGKGLLDPQRENWEKWCQQLAIFKGADRETHAHTYIEGDLFNWSQGLQRIHLGAFMESPPSDLPHPVSLNGESYLPFDINADHLDSAASMSLLIRSLISDARFARHAQMPLNAWAHFFHALLNYLHPDLDADTHILQACQKQLKTLQNLDPKHHPIGLRSAREFARLSLSKIHAQRGQPLNGGVTVAPLKAGHLLPFKALFIMGLGEGRFPEPGSSLALDLRYTLGTPPTPWERGAHTLLEALTLTQERLTLSYVSRDDETGDPLGPSSLVQQLLGVIERGYLHPRQHKHLRQKHPLRRHLLHPTTSTQSPRPTTTHSFLPEAHREAQAHNLHETLHSSPHNILPTSLELSSKNLQKLEPITLQAAWPPLSQQLGILPLPPKKPRFDGHEHLTIPIAALQKFLKSPLQGAARFILKMYANSDDNLEDEEPLQLQSLQTSILLQRVLLDGLQTPHSTPQTLAALLAKHTRAMELSGHHPTGVFAQVERTRQLRLLSSWFKGLQHQNLLQYLPLNPLQFGVGSPKKHPQQHAPSVDFNVTLNTPSPNKNTPRTIKISITGQTQALLNNLHTSLSPTLKPSAKKHRWLPGFLDHILLAASGLCADTPRNAVLLLPGNSKGNSDLLNLPPLSQDDALNYLRNVTEDLLNLQHDHILPIEAILDARLSKKPSPIIPKLHTLLKSRNFGNLNLLYGPIRNPHTFSPPHNAEEIADRRLGLFIDILRAKR